MHILFAGGGTAGHINPALAEAAYVKLKEPDAVISYIGTAKKLEATLVPKAGYNFYTIDVAGFQRRLTVKNIARNVVAVSKAVTSSIKAKRLLKELKPDIVVGTGGYVSGPVLREAVKLGIKTAIHEQNAFPGVTTKMLAPKVDAVMLAMPEAEKYLKCKNKPVVTGNPVRLDFLSLDKEKSKAALHLDNRPVVLSFGGSLGAAPINNAVADMIAKLYKSQNIMFIHATGKNGYEQTKAMLSEKGVDLSADNVRILPYIDDMADHMAAADIVIGRAGAITLTEIEAAGRASILIPSPYVAENHQYHNAMTLKNRNAAEVIEQKDLRGDTLSAAVEKMLSSPEITKQMGKNAAANAITDANARIYDCIKSL